MAFFAFLFVVVPLTEFLILSRVSEALGFANTVALVLLTGVLGGWLAKLEGLRVLSQWQGALSQGRMPEEGVVGGVLLFVGSILLVTPGVMTDAFGLLMLIPLTRKAFAQRVVSPWLEAKIAQGSVRVGSVGLAAAARGRGRAAIAPAVLESVVRVALG